MAELISDHTDLQNTHYRILDEAGNEQWDFFSNDDECQPQLKSIAEMDREMLADARTGRGYEGLV